MLNTASRKILTASNIAMLNIAFGKIPTASNIAIQNIAIWGKFPEPQILNFALGNIPTASNIAMLNIVVGKSQPKVLSYSNNLWSLEEKKHFKSSTKVCSGFNILSEEWYFKIQSNYFKSKMAT